MKKLLLVLVLTASVVIFGAPLAAHAASNMRSGNVATVARDEVVDATAYLAGSTIMMAGNVRGDLYCAGQNVDITGTVDGDVFCAAQTVTISGNVVGSVHVAAQTVTLSGPVGRSLSAFGQTVTLSGGAIINSDATIYGNSLQIGGKIGRDSVVGGQVVTMAGSVGRNVTSNSDQLSVISGARIGGSLEYTSHGQADIQKGSTIVGRTERHTPTQPAKDTTSRSWAAVVWGVGYWFVATLVLGLVLLAFVPRSFQTTGRLMVERSGWALLAGLVALIMTPIVVVMLFVTLIGVPLAVGLLFVWLMALFASFAYTGYSAGSWIVQQAGWRVKWQGAAALGVGLGILSLLMLVPVVGGLFGFLALIWGLGGITLGVGAHLKTRHAAFVTPKKKAA